MQKRGKCIDRFLRLFFGKRSDGIDISANGNERSRWIKRQQGSASLVRIYLGERYTVRIRLLAEIEGQRAAGIAEQRLIRKCVRTVQVPQRHIADFLGENLCRNALRRTDQLRHTCLRSGAPARHKQMRGGYYRNALSLSLFVQIRYERANARFVSLGSIVIALTQIGKRDAGRHLLSRLFHRYQQPFVVSFAGVIAYKAGNADMERREQLLRCR